MTVLTSIVLRNENTLRHILEQVTALVRQDQWIIDRLRAHDDRLDKTDARFPAVELRLDVLTERVDAHDDRLRDIEDTPR